MAELPAGRAAPFAVTSGVLRDQGRSLLSWGTALTAVTVVYVSFFPAVGGEEMQGMVDALPDGLAQALGYDQIGTAAGYLTGTVFGLLGPALLLVFAIGRGATLLAGLEEDGGLELELTSPVARRQVAGERLVALLGSVALLVAAVFAVTLLLRVVIDLEDVTVGGLAATSLGLFLLVAACSSVAFAAGAATGRRAVALAAGAGLAVVAYVADAIGSIVAGAAWLTDLSPWSWYLGGDPMREGVDPLGYGLLAAVIAVATVLAVTVFDRRDLGT